MTYLRRNLAAPAGTLPALTFSDGTLEALKWLGLFLMTLDHVNKYLLHSEAVLLFDPGRVVMPIFAIVLAYNLARPDAVDRAAYPRVMQRMAIAGVLATPPFIALGGLGWGWWPLNIMFTLLVATGVLYLSQGGKIGRVLAVGLFIIGGAFVEFWWPALAITVGAWSYFRRPSWTALLLALIGLAALFFINKNMWALAALPLFVLASRVDLPVPRLRWIFYAFYPLHLAGIWLLRNAA